MGIPQKLKEYINSNRGSLPLVADPDEPLQLNSLGLIRLVAFLENELGYRIEDAELLAENFATLRKVEELLARRGPGRSRKIKPRPQEGVPAFSVKSETERSSPTSNRKASEI